MASSISATAAGMPMSTARDTIEWPMFSSLMPASAATRPTLATFRAVPGVRLPAGGEAAFGRRLDLRELTVGFGAGDAGVGVRVQFEAGDVVLVG